jgi:hypothetical protein
LHVADHSSENIDVIGSLKAGWDRRERPTLSGKFAKTTYESSFKSSSTWYLDDGNGSEAGESDRLLHSLAASPRPWLNAIQVFLPRSLVAYDSRGHNWYYAFADGRKATSSRRSSRRLIARSWMIS